MNEVLDERSRKSQIEILRILKESATPVGSVRIVEALESMGVDMNERTVRFHLRRMDEQGLTRMISPRIGRVILPRGLEVLESERVINRMRFIVSKIDGLSYDMSFSPTQMDGDVVVNFSLIPVSQIWAALDEIIAAFRMKLGMGRLVLLKAPGECLGRSIVPEGYVGFGTVCSVTLNGALLKMSVPVASRYGCLLRLENGQPVGFTELVDYLGVTIDPLVLFLRAGMTSVRSAAKGQSGVVGASFREIPAAAGKVLSDVYERLERIGLGGVLAVGKPNQPLLNVPVNEGMIGLAVLGGINPVAAAHEMGITTLNVALHSLVGFNELFDFEELEVRMREIAK